MTAVLAAILTGRADPPEHAGPLRDLIESLLAKDPAARPDARSVVDALAAATAAGLADDTQVVVTSEADAETPVTAPAACAHPRRQARPNCRLRRPRPAGGFPSSPGWSRPCGPTRD